MQASQATVTDAPRPRRCAAECAASSASVARAAVWARKAVAIVGSCARQLECPEAAGLQDRATYDFLRAEGGVVVGEAWAFEARPDVVRAVAPVSFEDLVAAVAIAGSPSRTAFYFGGKRAGRAEPRLYPVVDEILGPTFGRVLYQEQVMWVAHRFAGYSFGGAHLLRRALGKRKEHELVAHRVGFVAGAIERGASESVAQTVFELLERDSAYAYCHSHAIGEAMLAYELAFLKAHHPNALARATAALV